ncbi:hypothetical protein Ddc_06588 [Ditylenchus destructor]|nr:hypothetical protein Ddc_06588 [Ditylenchus destructor]
MTSKSQELSDDSRPRGSIARVLLCCVKKDNKQRGDSTDIYSKGANLQIHSDKHKPFVPEKVNSSVTVSGLHFIGSLLMVP